MGEETGEDRQMEEETDRWGRRQEKPDRDGRENRRSQTEMERETQKSQTNNAVSFLVAGHECVMERKKKKKSVPKGLKAAARFQSKVASVPSSDPAACLCPFPLTVQGFWFTHMCT